MIGGRNFPDQPVKINIKTYESTGKNAISKGDGT